MKRLSCMMSGDQITKEMINGEISKFRLDELSIKIPEELLQFYIDQKILSSYHRVISSIDGKNEYDTGYFNNIVGDDSAGNKSIIENTYKYKDDDFFGKHHMIIFNESTGGDLFYVSYGQDDYGKVYFMSMDEGEDVEPVLLANSFGEFIDALEVDPEDMDLLMALPEDKRGDLP